MDGSWTGMFLQAQQPEGSWVSVLFPFVLMFGIFYFLLLRPQQKQQRKRQEMLNSLRRGTKVVTVGGIHGEITSIKDDTLMLRIADKVEIKMNKNGIGFIKGDESNG